MPKMKNGTATEQPLSKVAFVNSLSPETPVSDVVAKATEAGIALSRNYVYLIRSQAAKGSKAKRRGRPPTKSKLAAEPRATEAAPRAKGSLEAQFANFVADIGLGVY